MFGQSWREFNRVRPHFGQMRPGFGQIGVGKPGLHSQNLHGPHTGTLIEQPGVRRWFRFITRSGVLPQGSDFVFQDLGRIVISYHLRKRSWQWRQGPNSRTGELDTGRHGGPRKVVGLLRNLVGGCHKRSARPPTQPKRCAHLWISGTPILEDVVQL